MESNVQLKLSPISTAELDASAARQPAPAQKPELPQGFDRDAESSKEFDCRLVDSLTSIGCSRDDLDRTMRLATDTHEQFAQLLCRLQIVSENDLCAALASLCGAPPLGIGEPLGTKVPECCLSADFMREQGVWPNRRLGDSIEVALAFPHDRFILRSLEEIGRASCRERVCLAV